MSKTFYAFFALFIAAFLPGSARGEVEQVVIAWNSFLCNEKCASLIEKNFHKLPQVENVSINQKSGRASIQWKPNAPFSYAPIKTAMAMAGVGVNDIRVRVRGKIFFDQERAVLSSLGDNTLFFLVSPIRPDPGKQIAVPHPALRFLEPSLAERIWQDASQNKVVVIEGPLFQPASAYTLTLVVERILVEKPENQHTNR